VNAPDRLVIEGCAVATVDADGTEHASGHVVVQGDRILAVGAGPCPEEFGPARLVNCHHHLYQWITRGLAQQGTLFQWLTELYPIWARLDVEMEAAAARAALAALLTSGCSTTTDHHYLFSAGAGDLLAAGAPVGLGVDGAASNEAGQLGPELRQALLVARLRGGPAALTARQTLALGTAGGARCLSRSGELGSLEPSKPADVALWRLDGLGHADVEDPVAALVLGPPAPLELLLVGGRPVVVGGELRSGSEEEIARQARAASRRILDRREVVG
jgi:cytosine/adenosine deaminase-related metal-dependent hydrolase